MQCRLGKVSTLGACELGFPVVSYVVFAREREERAAGWRFGACGFGRECEGFVELEVVGVIRGVGGGAVSFLCSCCAWCLVFYSC